jgi:glycerol kinase
MTDSPLLAIDQGTSNTKALLVDRAGAILARDTRALARSYPHPGWVEQDPRAILESVQEALDSVMHHAGGRRPAALAISNQRESVLLWERRTGRPLGPCVLWQCRRTEAFCAALRARGNEPLVQERTGLPVDPLFSASKARWLLEQVPDGYARAEQGVICLGTVDCWLLWYLTGGAVHACDMSNAARTQLFNIHTLRWDPDLLDLFGIPAAALPEVKPSSTSFGESVPLGSLPGGVPIAAMIGDSHAALFGQGGFAPGTIKATYGTGTSLMTPTPAPRPAERGIASTVAWALDGVTYALEGNISVTGAAVDWLGRLLGFPDPVQAVAELATRVPDSGGAYLVPAFVGLGAPYWDAAARGLICGMTDQTSAAHLARATLDAIAFQVRDVFEVMRACSGSALRVLLADGGASRNDLLMQLQADTLGLPVVRTASPDVSALGAAYLAGLTAGLWSSEEEVASLIGPRDRFDPAMAAPAREARYAGWLDAIARTTLTRSSSSAIVWSTHP